MDYQMGSNLLYAIRAHAGINLPTVRAGFGGLVLCVFFLTFRIEMLEAYFLSKRKSMVLPPPEIWAFNFLPSS